MCTWPISASAVTPANIDTAMIPSRASVVAAFLLFGARNAGTPLLIASTPVSAVQPDANAFSSTKTSRKPLSWLDDAGTARCALSACGGWPKATLVSPQTISRATTPMKT